MIRVARQQFNVVLVLKRALETFYTSSIRVLIRFILPKVVRGNVNDIIPIINIEKHTTRRITNGCLVADKTFKYAGTV